MYVGLCRWTAQATLILANPLLYSHKIRVNFGAHARVPASTRVGHGPAAAAPPAGDSLHGPSWQQGDEVPRPECGRVGDLGPSPAVT